MGLGGEHEMTIQGMEEGEEGMELMSIEGRVGAWRLTKRVVIVIGVIQGEEG